MLLQTGYAPIIFYGSGLVPKNNLADFVETGESPRQLLRVEFQTKVGEAEANYDLWREITP